jgi:hypothetical protein
LGAHAPHVGLSDRQGAILERLAATVQWEILGVRRQRGLGNPWNQELTGGRLQAAVSALAIPRLDVRAGPQGPA